MTVQDDNANFRDFGIFTSDLGFLSSNMTLQLTILLPTFLSTHIVVAYGLFYYDARLLEFDNTYITTHMNHK